MDGRLLMCAFHDSVHGHAFLSEMDLAQGSGVFELGPAWRGAQPVFDRRVSASADGG